MATDAPSLAVKELPPRLILRRYKIALRVPFLSGVNKCVTSSPLRLALNCLSDEPSGNSSLITTGYDDSSALLDGETTSKRALLAHARTSREHQKCQSKCDLHQERAETLEGGFRADAGLGRKAVWSTERFPFFAERIMESQHNK